MTSIEYLEKEYNENKGFLSSSNFEQAKEIHKVEQEKLVDDALINYHIVDTNKTITEISDEEIEKEVNEYAKLNQILIDKFAWMDAIKWYREQLKKQL
jgi:aspartate carbamoyltransferase regulatory subunit